ncbi:ATP-binding protein [Sphaerisporangium dianthi]|uniref:histidine kinase n=1 Tax=Sphaerisporangium dianthi TaxID=1436120 RepID=A0ABV9CLB3_9ACTN
MSSLRWKIAALVAVASCAVALVVGLLVHRSTFDRALDLGESRAEVALLSAMDPHQRTGPGSDAGVVETAEIPPGLARLLPYTEEVSTWYDDRDPGIPWMWAAQRSGGRTFAVKIDMGPDMRSLRALDRHIVMASLAALAVVVPAAALAAELPNRRLRRVARTARRIAAGDLEARTTGRDHGGNAEAAAVLAGRRGDEISEISATVDLMADSLRDRLLSERRFTADVAHELRTPLMGLVTAAGLLPESEATELVRDRVRVLRVLVEDLLEISRLDAGVERADLARVPLGDVVEESAARTGLPARITVTGAATAETDPRRLDRIISNLLVNAHRHGRAPVEITVEGTSIVVRDHGSGFPDAVLACGPQRFLTGAAERGHGHGLGLTIALGQAGVIGASLAFANAPDGGAVATLRLPDLRRLPDTGTAG